MAYEVEAYWSRVAEQIGKRSRGGHLAGDDAPYFRYKRKKFLKRFLSQLDVRGKVVAELGCGPGGNLHALASKEPAKLVGIDISSTMLDLATNTLRDVACPVDLRKSDGGSIPLSDRAVDISYTVTVLQHNPDGRSLDRLVAELSRVTKSTLVLIEDIGTDRGEVHPSVTYVCRPVEDYVASAARAGFRLASADSLGLRASRTTNDRLWRKLIGRKHEEGRPIPLVARILLELSLIVTKHLDDFLEDRHDLTRMTFVREGSSDL